MKMMTDSEFAHHEAVLAQEGVSLRKLAEDEIADRKELEEVNAYLALYRWVADINAKVDRLANQKPQPPKVTSPYLTAEEAATYLRLDNVKKLYGLIERGKVKPLRGSRKLRFTIEILDEFLRGER